MEKVVLSFLVNTAISNTCCSISPSFPFPKKKSFKALLKKDRYVPPILAATLLTRFSVGGEGKKGGDVSHRHKSWDAIAFVGKGITNSDHFVVHRGISSRSHT